MNGLINFPQRMYYPTLKSNFKIPVIKHIIRILYAIPIPDKQSQKIKFLQQIKEAINNGKTIHFYPEGSLWPYCERIRKFKKGAFRIAVETNKPIIPILYKFEESQGIYKIYKSKKCIHAKVMEPIYPNNSLEKIDRINDLMARTLLALEKNNNEITIDGQFQGYI